MHEIGFLRIKHGKLYKSYIFPQTHTYKIFKEPLKKVYQSPFPFFNQEYFLWNRDMLDCVVFIFLVKKSYLCISEDK